MKAHENIGKKATGSSAFFFLVLCSSERLERLSVLRQLMLYKELEALGLQMSSGKTRPPDLPRVKVAE